MEHRANEILREAEEAGLQQEAGGAPHGQPGGLGRRILRESGQALSALGAWLAQRGAPGDMPLDSGVRPTA
jgi:hypothetical protein